MLSLENEEAVRQAFHSIRSSVTAKSRHRAFLGVTVQPMVRLDGYELILGSSVDAQFGPVILFGSGGQLVEVYRDRTLALPPLNTTLARRMMEQTRIFGALKGVRGRAAVDIALLEQVLVRFSRMVVEQRRIKEVDINPSPCVARGRAGARCTNRPLRTRNFRRRPSALNYHSLSLAICIALENKRWNGNTLSANPAGGRADDGEISRDTFR